MTGLIPSGIVEQLEMRIASSLKSFSFSSGGCINNGGKLITSSGSYFLKWNDLHKYPGMFNTEARGLRLLSQGDFFFVPDVIYEGTTVDHQFLLLEFIEEGRKMKTYWDDFGTGLASLHRVSTSTFGLDHDNYIGALPQSNEEEASWTEFFAEHRLRRQLKMAVDCGRLEASIGTRFESLFARLPSLLPQEMPSLLHGDLWSGNLMTTHNGRPALIDPAVYYGHREVDLAMTQLFGGFDPVYLKSYEEMYPLLPGYEERFELYNLYPLLVHVNLFGGGYVSQLVSTLGRFV